MGLNRGGQCVGSLTPGIDEEWPKWRAKENEFNGLISGLAFRKSLD